MAPNAKLKAWIERNKLSVAAVARLVNYDRHNFHRIVAGNAKPTMELADAIAKVTGGDVPLTDWIGFQPQPSQAAA